VAERAERAALALRRALTAGHDHDEATAELLAAAATLATLRDRDNEELASPEQASATHDCPLTTSVTDTAVQLRPAAPTPESHRLPAGPAQRSGEHVTKPVTKQAARQHPSSNGDS
jgi:hypothetical protein